ncbi:MAG: AraC family transcriptional regulator [Bacteroidota bacterium]|nr:AraC family transcriptional regulator [Bacteroidota bacterium]MDP4247122.1 AraC family transcriptional regulator [Bacteroidota bacterium]MDP4253191.1 AraC family transcriptional regulator [Bacteroidota bacterium]MDP4259358.1 AraC family transcriptional regulator [Bacteroidota bacterium]
MQDRVMIMREFPDFRAPGFDMEAYNERFLRSLVIIHARSSDIDYPEHWGCLSVKCAFGGDEHYRANGTVYAVNQDHFLILNEGQQYSSYIFSERPVHSFTVNFPAPFAASVAAACLADPARLLDDGLPVRGRPLEFMERLYPHGGSVTSSLRRLYRLSSGPEPGLGAMVEAHYELLEGMLFLQEEVLRDIRRIPAAKRSTRVELYKRLHFARDYMSSCYMGEVTLEDLAGVACMNSAYFLRAFKRHFGITPHQYLIQTRIAAARRLLTGTDMPVREVCFQVGYQDTVSFIRLFRRHCEGLTPEKYQAQHRKKSLFTYWSA